MPGRTGQIKYSEEKAKIPIMKILFPTLQKFNIESDDIMVFRMATEHSPDSYITGYLSVKIIEPVYEEGIDSRLLSFQTKVRSKNGSNAAKEMTLTEIVEDYNLGHLTKDLPVLSLEGLQGSSRTIMYFIFTLSFHSFNIGINIFFAIVYGLIILSCLYFTILFRRSWLAYTIILGVGAGLELTGCVFRTGGHENSWELTGFTIQFVFLTIAPVFMTASVYISLEHIAQTVGHGYLQINPGIYPRVFIPSDVIVLVLHVGVAMSSNENEGHGLANGVKITITGLVFRYLASLSTPSP
ncbi:hypothetical protein B7463_g2585, partial [Scytalidium lignicola]